MSPSLFRAAVWYSDRGWPVLALAPRSKLPLVSRKRGGKGVKDATTDIEQISSWWAKAPNANVALAAGSHWWALDIDVKPEINGLETLAKLTAEYGRIPPTVTQITGARGRQLLFLPDERITNRVNANKLPGLDVRSTGGYIVAPPSVHPDTGLAYLWAYGKAPHETALARAPEWLVEALAHKPEPERPRGERRPIRSAEAGGRYVRAAIDAELDRLHGAPKGQRNHTLFAVACRLYEFVGGGYLPSGTTEAALIEGAEAIGLKPDEYRKTIRSAKKQGLAKPRGLPT